MPGDIIIWVGHMGIVIGPNQMISARSTSLKTSISSLSHGTPLMKVGRYQ
jgi:cell wall-associated NlpC family hydrolase